MKLMKAASEEVCDFNEVEFLQMENDFLRDELELRDSLHSLELMETVLKCIEQEGGVSKSIEVMFGEGQDMSTFKDDLQKAYDEAMEAFNINYDKKSKSAKPMYGHLSVHHMNVFRNVTRTLDSITEFVNKNDFNFPFELGFAIGDNERSKRTALAIERASELVEKQWDVISFDDLNRIIGSVKDAFENKSDVQLNERKVANKQELLRYIDMFEQHTDKLRAACLGFNRIVERIAQTYLYNKERAEKSDNLNMRKHNAIERVLNYLVKFAYITCKKDVTKLMGTLQKNVKK